MRIAGLVQDSIVDGPGMRFTIFTQGCNHNCPGCHNPETHDPNGGKEMSIPEILKEMLKNPLTDGVTFSGGDPFCQAADCAVIAKTAHENGFNVWSYTGYTFEQLFELAKSDDGIKSLLEQTNVLVDGPFILSQRSLSTPWRGSKNQRLIDVQKSLASGSVVLYEK